jgi:hypothetical protein
MKTCNSPISRRGFGFRPKALLLTLIVSSPIGLCQGAAPVAAENTGPNASITRRASGVYRYESIAEHRLRGEERWQFLAHPDGSRSLLIWNDLAARSAQFSVFLRVLSSFRPAEAFVSYWNAGSFKGSAHFRVDGRHLFADSAGPYGTRADTVEVPEEFSIGTHPVAGDGWHSWPAALDAAGKTTSTLYVLEAGADPAKPVLGTLTPLAIEIVGPETVEVPAGRFNSVHLRLSGVNDLWITPQDRLVIKSVIPARNLQYVLSESSGELR